MTARRTSSSSSDTRRMSINDVQLPADVVKGLSVQVLKEIQKQSDATFFEYFEGLKLNDVLKVRERVQKITERNCEIAIKNLDLEPQIHEKKALLVEKNNELNELRENYNKKFSELKAIEGKKSHKEVERELLQSSRKIEQKSEDFAADFIGGKSSLSLEEFSEEFVKQRTLFWLRKVKSDKMKELVIMPQSSGPLNSMPMPGTSYPPPSNAGGHFSDPSSSVPPYPMATNMPQPQSSLGGRGGGQFPMASYASVPASMPARPPPPRPTPYAGHRMNQHRY